MTTESPKPRPVAVWLIAALFAIVAGAAAYYYGETKQEAPQQEVTAVQPAPSAEAPAQPGQADAPAAGEEKAAMETAEPKFDVLRVEKDGSAVIAGSAPASSKVELLSGGSVIASTEAGPGGDFAIVLDEPLAKGNYELALRATAPDGTAVMSTETGIVSIPEEGGELMAMVSREGGATRVTQAPEPAQEAPAPEPAQEVPAAEAPSQEQAPEQQEVARTEPPPEAQTQGGEASSETASEAEEAPQAAAPAAEPETETPAMAQPDVQPVLVKAVDVEGNRIFIAGAGEPGRDINLYVDGEFLGSTRVGPEGGFLLEATGDLAPGAHEIRADMLAENGADVTNRAVVPLIHEVPETELAQAEPAEPAEPAPTAPKTGQAPATGEASQAAPAAEAEEPASEGGAQIAGETAKPAEETAPATGEAAESAPATPAEPAGQAAEPAAAEPKEGMAKTEMAGEEKPEPIRTGASVIIRRGDNLWRISHRMLGAGIKYTIIYDANRDQIRDPHWIYPGQVFDVPGAIQEMDRN